MQMTVGLDFGTTNSILSYWDGKKPVKYDFAEQFYIPSAIAYNENKLISIGNGGLTYWKSHKGEVELLRFFKTLLSYDDPKEWRKRGWNHIKSPREATKDFLEYLLITSKDSFTENEGKIKNLVVSVPELWQNAAANKGAENLLKVIENDLGLQVNQLLSEPVAAVAYYVWKAKLKKGEKRRILVCDMGGGTFDVSLCEASKNSISVKAFGGNDNDQAGVFKLKEILRNVYKRLNKKVAETSFEFKKDLWELDKNIKLEVNGERLSSAFESYQKDPVRWGEIPVIKSGDLEVRAIDVFSAFKRINTGIQEVFDKLKKRNNGTIDFDQLLMVGGFSQYFLVRKTILDYFGLNETHEKVKIVPKKDSIYAISYGATLAAAGIVNIEENYPHNIYFQSLSEKNETVPILIFGGGKEFKPNTPVFAKTRVKIIGNKFPLEGFVELEGDKELIVPFSKPLELQFKTNPKEKYRIGVEINRSNMALCVIEDEDSQLHQIPLGELFKEGIYEIKED